MLTDKAIRAAAPREKPYKLADGRGLVLIVDPRGGKYWRYRYRIGGKEKKFSLGTYPDVSLKRAREKLDDARKLVADGIDPSAKKRADKVAAAASVETFASVAEDYFGPYSKTLSAATVVRDRRILKKLVDRLGARTLDDIKTPDVMAALRAIAHEAGAESAHRALGLASRIYAHAFAIGKVTNIVVWNGLGKQLAPTKETHRAAITNPREFGALLRAIYAYSGQPATIAALKLLAMLFVRPGELRLARWPEFDLDAGEWRIPAERTKLRREHLVPLPRQAIAVLRELHAHTGAGEHVLASLRPGRPLSENTINLALRGMGFDGTKHVAHGFRSTASTLLHEQGFDSQVIELQLAHADKNKVRAAYNRAERIDERRKMLQQWAEYCDQLRSGANVATFGSARRRSRGR